MKLKIDTGGNHGGQFQIYVENAIKVGFDTRNSTFVLALSILVGADLNKKLTMEKGKIYPLSVNFKL